MQFYEQNQFRAYPFLEDAALIGTVNGSETVCIPNAAFVDLRVILSKQIPAGVTVLDEIEHTGTQLRLKLNRSGYPMSLPIPVLADIATRGSDPAGVYTFLVVTGPALVELAETIGSGNSLVLAPAPAVLPTLVRDASSASVHSISDGTTPLTGAVTLEEGYNCAATVTPAKIKLPVGLGRGAGTSCDDTDIACAKALFRINGQEANSKGEFNLVPGKGIMVVPHPGQHALDIFAVGADECKA